MIIQKYEAERGKRPCFERQMRKAPNSNENFHQRGFQPNCQAIFPSRNEGGGERILIYNLEKSQERANSENAKFSFFLSTVTHSNILSSNEALGMGEWRDLAYRDLGDQVIYYVQELTSLLKPKILKQMIWQESLSLYHKNSA